jgi:hypothetical protein
MLSVIPVRFECTNDEGDIVFTVNAFDAECAEVDIKLVVTVDSWKEISKHVLQCLESMELEEQQA